MNRALPSDAWEHYVATSARVLRRLADISSNARDDAKNLTHLADDMVLLAPAAAEHLGPAAELLREIEGRYCDVTDRIHAAGRKLEALA